MIEYKHRSAGEVDQRLKTIVMARLLSGTGTPPGCVAVNVEDGWILLSGEVDYRFQQQAVASQFEGLENVRGVRNGVSIRPRTGRTVWDDFFGRDVDKDMNNCRLRLSDLALELHSR